jgi:hypothetical protein
MQSLTKFEITLLEVIRDKGDIYRVVNSPGYVMGTMAKLRQMGLFGYKDLTKNRDVHITFAGRILLANEINPTSVQNP